MGNRALVQFKRSHGNNNNEYSPAIYLHWSGDMVKQWLIELRKLMEGRSDDLSYVSARFIGLCHEKIPGNLSLGVWNNPGVLTADDTHGDNGIFIVDITENKWKTTRLGYSY